MELKVKPIRTQPDSDNALLKEVQETARLSIDVTKDVRRRLKMMVAAREMTINEIVNMLILDELKRAGF